MKRISMIHMLLSLIRRYRYLKKLDSLTFPEKPIPIKIVFKGKGPATYWKDVKQRGNKPKEESYEVVIFSRPGQDLQRAVHEVRHRVQYNNPEMPLFTRDKLLAIQRQNPQPVIRYILDYLEAVENKGEPLPTLEQDAIITERAIEQRCKNVRNPIETASRWIKATSETISPPLFFQAHDANRGLEKAQ